jgi:lipoate-protein ligase B
LATQITVSAYWLGSVPYREAWDIQRALVAAVGAGAHPPSLLLVEHPHVFTIGRRGDGSTLLWSEAECARRGVEVVWTDRGGDATYHGPGQLVGYPIVDLTRLQSDVIRHIRSLERSLIAYLGALGIPAEPGGPGMTGVWSQGAGPPDATPGSRGLPGKVGAIGVKLTRPTAAAFVTSHGFALNLTTDLGIFNQGIVPCGLVGREATSVAALGGPVVEVAEAARAYPEHFAASFGVEVAWAEPGELSGLPVPPSQDIPGRAVLNVLDRTAGQRV